MTLKTISISPDEAGPSAGTGEGLEIHKSRSFDLGAIQPYTGNPCHGVVKLIEIKRLRDRKPPRLPFLSRQKSALSSRQKLCLEAVDDELLSGGVGQRGTGFESDRRYRETVEPGLLT